MAGSEMPQRTRRFRHPTIRRSRRGSPPDHQHANGMLYTTIDNSSFVTRAKSNLDAPRVYLHARDRSTGVICDQSVALNGFYSNRHYPMAR